MPANKTLRWTAQTVAFMQESATSVGGMPGTDPGARGQHALRGSSAEKVEAK